MMFRKFIIFLMTSALLLSSLSFAAGAQSADIAGAGSDGETATVTLKTLEGTTAVKTFGIGDTFTVYTFLDTSDIDDGKISAVMGNQIYTDGVLTLADELDEEDGIVDTETVFPVLDAYEAIGHLTDAGNLEFIGSTPRITKPFIFDTSDSKLIVTQYEVTAGGEATVETALTTLAKSDSSLTKIIKNGVLQDDASISFFSLFADEHSHDMEQIEAIAPTQSADGNIAYRYCGECGGFFEESSDTRISLEDTVISRQRVRGTSVSLEGDIGVNIYLYIPDFFTGDIAASYTWGSSGKAYSYSDTPSVNASYGANYVTSCYVSAKNMTDTIHMSVTADGEEILTYDTKVADYAVKAAEYYPDDTELGDLLCNMLEYGAAAQRFFEYNIEGDEADIADSYIADIDGDWQPEDAPESLTAVTNMTNDALSAYGLSYSGSSLVTTSATAIKIFLSVTDEAVFENTSLKIGSSSYEFDYDDDLGLMYIEIGNISAKNIFDAYTLTFSNGDDAENYLYSAASYYNGVMNGNYTENHKNVVAAMYNYYLSAKSYL